MFSLSKRMATLGGKAKIDSKQRREGTTTGTDLTYMSFELGELKLDAAELGDVAAAPEPKKRKAKRKSPTQRTLEHMRELGYLCQVVEKWNPHAMIRQDLFGFIDVLCIKEGNIIGVQACSGGDVSTRIAKIVEHDNWPTVCRAIRVVVHGWRKNAAGRWVLREVEL